MLPPSVFLSLLLPPPRSLLHVNGQGMLQSNTSEFSQLHSGWELNAEKRDLKGRCSERAYELDFLTVPGHTDWSLDISALFWMKEAVTSLPFRKLHLSLLSEQQVLTVSINPRWFQSETIWTRHIRCEDKTLWGAFRVITLLTAPNWRISHSVCCCSCTAVRLEMLYSLGSQHNSTCFDGVQQMRKVESGTCCSWPWTLCVCVCEAFWRYISFVFCWGSARVDWGVFVCHLVKCLFWTVTALMPKDWE